MSTSPETNPPIPDLTKLTFEPNYSAYGTRIQQAAWKISEFLPTQYRAYVDGYFRFISPKMAWAGEVNFPTALRRHPRNPERTTMAEKENVLYFLIGNAIIAWYDVIKKKGKAMPDVDFMERQIVTLEEVAKAGYAQCIMEGSDADGFTLIPRDFAKVSFLAKDGINEDGRTQKE